LTRHANCRIILKINILSRYNNYTKDPLSTCDCSPPFSGENTIAARSDLNPASGKYPFDALGHRDHGATDMKVSFIFLFNFMKSCLLHQSERISFSLQAIR
jgi:hypothetical protein